MEALNSSQEQQYINSVPEMFPTFISTKEIASIMAKIGVHRGFGRSSINRKIAEGSFDVPFIISGNQRLFRPRDVIAYWNRQSTYTPGN